MRRAKGITSLILRITVTGCGLLTQYCAGDKIEKDERAGYVVRMGEERVSIGSSWGNRREGDHWGDLGVDVWVILGWVSRRWDVGIWTGLGWPRIEKGGGHL